MGQFTKLNQQFGILEYPVTLEEMKQISLDFPKTERKFYEFAFNALKKVMKKDERIYSFNSANPKLTKTGFIVLAENNLILISMKGGLLGGADAETIKYKDIKNVDFDIIPSPLGTSAMESGILYLEMKGLLGGKKRTIRNIPDYHLDSLVKSVRDKISKA